MTDETDEIKMMEPSHIDTRLLLEAGRGGPITGHSGRGHWLLWKSRIS